MTIRFEKWLTLGDLLRAAVLVVALIVALHLA